MSTQFSGLTISELCARVDETLAIYKPSSVEMGGKWDILSAVFRRLNDFEQIIVLREHLADAMLPDVMPNPISWHPGDYPSEELYEKVSFYFDLARIQDCLMEEKRDLCTTCGTMEGLHINGRCPDQQCMTRGMFYPLSRTFTR